MNTAFFAIATLVLVPIATSAQLAAQPQQSATITLNAEQRASLRCAAAFALVSHGQSIKNEAALKWPEMGEKGREYFVRASAQLMDETGATRAQISQLLSREAQSLIDTEQVDQIMPSCLVMLGASGV